VRHFSLRLLVFVHVLLSSQPSPPPSQALLSSGSCNAKVNQGRELAFVAVIPGCSSVYLLQALLTRKTGKSTRGVMRGDGKMQETRFPGFGLVERKSGVRVELAF